MSSFRLIAAMSVLLGGSVLAADLPKLHPVESYTVVYRQTGASTGVHTVHSRAFGAKRVELADVVVTLRGMKLPMKRRTVVDGKRMTSIDSDDAATTTSTDPTYDAAVTAMVAGGALDTIMLGVWKAKPTGKTKTYAGESCGEFLSTDKRHTYCSTKDGILLYINQGGANVRFERTATEIRRKDGGPDSAFTIPEASAP